MGLKQVDLKSEEGGGAVSVITFVIFLLIAVGISIGIVMWQAKMIDDQIYKKEQEISKVQKELEQYKAVKPKIERLRKEINEIQKNIKEIREKRYQPLKVKMIITELSQVLPDTIWISTLSIKPSSHTLSFTAKVKPDAGGYLLKDIALMLDKMRATQGKAVQFISPSISTLNYAEVNNIPTYGFTVTTKYIVDLFMQPTSKGGVNK